LVRSARQQISWENDYFVFEFETRVGRVKFSVHFTSSKRNCKSIFQLLLVTCPPFSRLGNTSTYKKRNKSTTTTLATSLESRRGSLFYLTRTGGRGAPLVQKRKEFIFLFFLKSIYILLFKGKAKDMLDIQTEIFLKKFKPFFLYFSTG
jgi:hypothetical protein